MSTIENVSRRRFLTGGIIATGALVLGVRYYPKLSLGDKLPHDTNADHATLHPSVYLGLNPDGTVWIVASRSEMGTTSRTTLPLIVADELDADWKRVKIEQAPVGCSRCGVQNRFARSSSSRDEPQIGLRRTRRSCGKIANPQERRAEAQTEECLAVCRQGASDLRPRSACDREGHLWHGCAY